MSKNIPEVQEWSLVPGTTWRSVTSTWEAVVFDRPLECLWSLTISWQCRLPTLSSSKAINTSTAWKKKRKKELLIWHCELFSNAIFFVARVAQKCWSEDLPEKQCKLKDPVNCWGNWAISVSVASEIHNPFMWHFVLAILVYLLTKNCSFVMICRSDDLSMQHFWENKSWNVILGFYLVKYVARIRRNASFVQGQPFYDWKETQLMSYTLEKPNPLVTI